MLKRSYSRILIQALVLSAIAGHCLGQEKYARDRYELIVERSPFGAEPVNISTEQDANSPQVRQAQQELRLCFLMQSDISGEVRAGFQNLKAAKGDPKSVILMEGESFRSMKLVDIDLEGSTATLEYNGAPVTFELAKSKTPAPTPAARRRTTPPTQPTRRFGGGFRSRTQPEAPEQQEEEELTPEEREERIAEIRAKLQDQQMEIIRQGQPPLPIQLTPEQDDQLVAEGVLPPLEDEEEN